MNHSVKAGLSIAVVCLLLFNTVNGSEQSVSVGGHAGITILDGAYGISSDGFGNQDTSSDYTGFRFLKFILFFRYAFNEKLSVDIRPQIETRGVDGTTGATPKFGKEIGDQRARKVSVNFNNFTRAVATYVLPSTTELSVGYVNTKFTWEYGNELFCEDEMNGSPFACNHWLADLSDAGIELVHYFDIGEITIPLHAYILNGSGMEEINRTPIGMISAETQVGICKFHLAAAGGTWDDEDEYAMVRGSAGMSIKVKKMTLRTEGAIGYWEQRIKGSPDNAVPHGAYLKLIVPFTKHVRMSLGASYVYNNFVDIYNPLPGEETYYTLTPAFQILTSSSSRIILQCDVCDWKQKPSEGAAGEKILKLIHGTIGWRLTF